MNVVEFYKKHEPKELTNKSVIELMEKWNEYCRVGALVSCLTPNNENQDDFGIETFQQFNAWFENKIL